MSVLLFFSILNVFQGDTIASPWPFQHVDELSNSAVTSVFMDQNDRVWLGTWDGLDRYDGSSITVYKPDPFSQGKISNNVVRDFLEDGDGNLWIITHQGINKYNRATDSFQTYLDSLPGIPFLEYNIRACKGSDSTIWTSLLGKGIYHYLAKDNNFVPINFEQVDSLWLQTVVNVGSHQGLLYLLGRDGKLVCTVNNRQIFSKQLLDIDPLSFHKFLTINHHYYLAITSRSGEFILVDLSNIERKPQHIQLKNMIISSLSENLAQTAIWVGTESGDIFKLKDTGTEFSAELMNSFFPAFSRAKIKILTITETNQNLLWIGTDGDGVYKFLTRPKTFFAIHSGTESGQISHGIVRSVYEDASGTLYIGTRGGGLNIISSSETKIINTHAGLSNDAVLSINKDHAGNMWIGVDGEGVDMIEVNSQKIFHFPRDLDDSHSLVFGSVYSICIDSFNDIWLGTSGFGIVHLKVEKRKNGKYHLKEFDQIKPSSNVNGISLKSNIVFSIIEEKPNTLWFGTRGGGVYRFNSLSKQIEEEFLTKSQDRNSLGNNDVLSLYIDHQDQLWVGTSGGLDRLYIQNKPYRIVHYTERERLPNNTIHGILEDASSNIWISTNRGLSRYDREKDSFRNFDANDGLQNNEFTDGASFKSNISEKLFFGGIDGLDVVDPGKLSELNYFPRLSLTGFHVRSVSIHPGDDTGLLSSNIDFTDMITLNYDQNFIGFAFTILDYWNKRKSEYHYRLVNFDKGWNFIGHQESITLTNIPPGGYTLEINYRNENGAWSPTPRKIKLVITPPFWRTYWAYTFYILLAIGIQLAIVFYLRWRARAKKELAIERLKAEQLKEINDYKLQFFTNIAHEFRTPLTMILGPAAWLLQKTVDVSEKIQLKTIYSNSLRLQKLIEELIQFRKIETGKDQLEISVTDLIPFTQEIVETFQNYAIEREVHLEFHTQPETLEAFIDPKKIEKILINLISNALKYSSKDGIVSISLKQESNLAIFEIQDEGVGVAEENKNKIFENFYHNPIDQNERSGLAKSTGIGLSLTKSLVQTHGGTIELMSQLGKGSKFTVRIPITREYYSKLQLNESMATPSANLHEKILLEFETDHDNLNLYPDGNSSPSGKHEYTILVVDDNQQITSLLRTLLADRYDVLIASNGVKAIALLEDVRIDLVISDVLMPDMDGLELCKKIKDHIQTSHIPVILLTAKAEIENRIEGLQVGADSYIPKPFHPEHLFIRIQKLLERMELTRKKFQNSTTVELQQLSTGFGEKEDSFFSKITKCIQENFTNPEFNAEQIGDEVGMSKASLYKKVKTITGLTPHGLIKQYRLKKAAELLRSSGLSVSEVIYETGFNSRSYFYKSFNEVFHCHPKDFI